MNKDKGDRPQILVPAYLPFSREHQVDASFLSLLRCSPADGIVCLLIEIIAYPHTRGYGLAQIYCILYWWLLSSLRRILLPLLRFLCDVSSSSLPRRGIVLVTSVREIATLTTTYKSPCGGRGGASNIRRYHCALTHLQLAHFHEGAISSVSGLLLSIRQLVCFCLHILQGCSPREGQKHRSPHCYSEWP